MAEPDWDWYAEAERRGLLQGDDADWYAEAQRRGLVPGSTPAPAAAPKPPGPEGFLGNAADIAKSVGVGLGQGALGLATTVGNIEGLGRGAINWAGDKLGASGDVVDPVPHFMDYNRLKAGIERDITGEFYKPQTTAGKYARTGGEFAAGGLTPGSVARKLAAIAGPAFVSETAGQLTEGTAFEPWARVAGGFSGAMIPRAFSTAVTPQATGVSQARRDVAPHVANLEQQGVDALTAGQRTGSKKWQFREEQTRHTPLGPNTYDNQARDASRQFTQAAWRQAGQGLSHLDNVGPDAIAEAITHFNQRYNNIAVNARVNADPALISRLDTVVRRYRNVTPRGDRVPLVENIVEDLRDRARTAQVVGGTNGTSLSGEAYRTFYSRLREQQQKFQKAGPARQAEAEALGDIIDHLNTAMVASAPPNMRNALRREMTQLNRDYSNFKLIEKATETGSGEWAAQGMLSPAKLRQSVIRRNGRNYTAGRSEMGRLARSGEAVLRPLPSSGTAERTAAREWMDGTNTRSVLAGGLGLAATGDPITGAALTLGARSIPTLKSHALMSSPVQRWLSNNTIPERWPQAGAEFQGAFAPTQLYRDDWEEQ